MNQASPRVDFYVLESDASDARLRFACRLSEKAWNLHHRVHALTDDHEAARKLDELMWTFRAGSFLPHAINETASDEENPITIGSDTNIGQGELLINLTELVPTCYDQFQRIAEIVGGNPASRNEGRKRFSFYRDNGYAPQTHRID